MVKMYELDTTEPQAEAATQAAAEFRDYVALAGRAAPP